MEKRIYKCMVGEREITVETGHLAEQAGGAITIREGDTHVFVTATMSKSPRDVDFFPLSVDFEERLYAAGRIPGSYFRREGRPPVSAILIARLTDRPLRPLFPKNMRNEVQVIEMPLSADQVHQVDILAVCGASAALHISDIPWEGPIGAVRVGLIDGQFVVNPTHPQMKETTLDLRLAATEDAILMVECVASEVEESVMVDALQFGHEAIQPFIALQKFMRQEIGKEKREYDPIPVDENLREKVAARIQAPINEIIRTRYDRDERDVALDDLRELITEEYSPSTQDEPDDVVDLKQVQAAFSDVIKSEVRRQILEDGVRPDGRGYTEVRELSAETSFTPRAHGSGLFKRGQTQVLSLLTLGTPRDAQELDGVEPEESRRYMHHYNFPPYSTGETWFMRGPKRREIGHGQLAENALLAVLPDETEFPYTVRVVSEVMSSNGSTSMASVCASTLALMDGGVPISAPVGGIAMGLIKGEDKYAVLTDIQGMEDHLGDMDFKVAGTRRGINALQMDIKVKGLSDDIMRQALDQARDARLQILDVMEAAISAPRTDINQYAPRIETVKIDPEKIGAVIGKGGETIRGIQEKTGAKIDIEEDGTVYIATADGSSMQEAIDTIKGLTQGAEVGAIYTGKVTRVEDYGAFVEILPGTDGLVHISQLDTYRVNAVRDIVSVGDEIMVMVTDSDHGKLRLSRQAVLEGWTLEEAQANDSGIKKGGGGGGNRGGGRGNRGGGRGGNRGGNRN